jgi:hypothetical protein
MLTGSIGGGGSKIDQTVFHVMQGMWDRKKEIYDICVECRSLEHTWAFLKKMIGIGPFLAYEMVTDLRHTHILNDAVDIMTWANPGPGAIRGLRRIFGPHVKTTHGEANVYMKKLLDRSDDGFNSKTNKHHLDTDFPTLEMRDIEHWLCEFDKYVRVMNGEGRPRSRYDGGR